MNNEDNYLKSYKFYSNINNNNTNLKGMKEKKKLNNYFNHLSIDIQLNIYYQNVIYYKQIILRLMDEKNLINNYYFDNLNILRNELQSAEYYLTIWENKNNLHNIDKITFAKNLILNHYKFLLNNIETELNILIFDYNKLSQDIESNKKFYYYFYHKYKDILKVQLIKSKVDNGS